MTDRSVFAREKSVGQIISQQTGIYEKELQVPSKRKKERARLLASDGPLLTSSKMKHGYLRTFLMFLHKIRAQDLIIGKWWCPFHRVTNITWSILEATDLARKGGPRFL